jgi:hypothetical protein
MSTLMFEEQTTTVALSRTDDFLTGLALGIAIGGLFFC